MAEDLETCSQIILEKKARSRYGGNEPNPRAESLYYLGVSSILYYTNPYTNQPLLLDSLVANFNALVNSSHKGKGQSGETSLHVV